MTKQPKTVLITGASSGIGKATAVAFAKRGWNVAATMRQLDAEIFEQYPNVRCYMLDVTDTDAIHDTFVNVHKDFASIDVVVNNAGYAVSGVFESIDKTTIQKQFDTNVFGLMEVTRAAIKTMRMTDDGGTIIQVASMGGRLTFPSYSIYHASKWAVEGFSEALHYELLQFNIRIKILEPGVIKTDFYNTNKPANLSSDKLGYNEFLRKADRATGTTKQNGEDPAIVANTIVNAATDRSSRLRYVVGRPAPQLLLLRKLLPERLFFYLAQKKYKI